MHSAAQHKCSQERAVTTVLVLHSSNHGHHRYYCGWLILLGGLVVVVSEAQRKGWMSSRIGRFGVIHHSPSRERGAIRERGLQLSKAVDGCRDCQSVERLAGRVVEGLLVDRTDRNGAAANSFIKTECLHRTTASDWGPEGRSSASGMSSREDDSSTVWSVDCVSGGHPPQSHHCELSAVIKNRQQRDGGGC